MGGARRMAVLLAVAGSLLGAAPAHAAVTIGNNLSATPSGSLYCAGGPCTIAPMSVEAQFAASGGQTAPAAGIVVRWRAKMGTTPGALKLRILKPGLSATTRAVGTSAAVTAPANTTSTFLTRLPIAAGDGLGLDCCAGGGGAPAGTTAGYGHGTFDEPLVDGGPTDSANSISGGQMLVNADIETDADKDGFGDETQDNCKGLANPTQADFNRDRVGDACADADRDGIIDSRDTCKTTANPDQADTNKDGRGDGCDAVAPTFIQTALSRTVFAVDPKGAVETPVLARKRKKPAPTGTVFTLYLTEAARVVFRIDRKLGGRKVKGKCRKVTRRNRERRKCSRYKLFGRFAMQAKAGRNDKSFSGRIGGKKLSPGRWRAIIVARDPIGNVSKAQRVSFKVVKRR